MLNGIIKKLSALLIGIAALTFASCSEDRLIESNPGLAIDFQMDLATRSQEFTNGNVGAFYVTAVGSKNNLFTNIAFTKTNGIFSSSTAYFWPDEEASLDFYAYAPSAAELGASCSDGLTITGVETQQTFAEQTDFIVARQSVSKTSQTIPLHFEHKLSMIEVKAKNANDAYNYKIKGIRLAGLHGKADYSLETDKWSNFSEPLMLADEYSEIELDGASESIMGNGGNAMVIPQELSRWSIGNETGAYIGVLVQITTKAGAKVYPRPGSTEEYEWMLIPISTTLQAGTKYIYTLDFTTGAGLDTEGNDILGESITFDVNEIQWTGKSTAAYLYGSWDLIKVETYRAWDAGIPDDEKTWPDYSIYLPTDDDFYKNPSKVPSQTIRVRFVEEGNIYLFPGIPQFQTMGNFEVRDGKLYVEAALGGQAATVEYLLLDYGQDNFSIITNEDNGTYFMKKMFYYKKADNDFELFGGQWEIDDATWNSKTINSDPIGAGTFDWRTGLPEEMWKLNFFGNTVQFDTDSDENNTAEIITYDDGRCFGFKQDEENETIFSIKSQIIDKLTLTFLTEKYQEVGGREQQILTTYNLNYKKSTQNQ